jgi:carbonic anhydrase
VVAQLDHLRTHPSVAARLANGRIQLHGWVYNIRAGEVHAWDAHRARYVPLEEYNLAAPRPRTRLAVGG